MAKDPGGMAQGAASLGALLAALRAAAGLTQNTLAALSFYSRSSIANIETGRQSAPRSFWMLCDEILNTGGILTAEHDRICAARREHQRQALANRDGVGVNVLAGKVLAVDELRVNRWLGEHPDGHDVRQLAAATAGDAGEDVVDVLARVHKLSRAVDPMIVEQLRSGLLYTLANYDVADHRRLVASLIKQRAWLETLIEECSHPEQRQRLFEIATLVSGLLGYLAVGRAAFRLARAYSLEGFHLADYAQDSNLRAWARGIQSFCEYYAGDYQAALHLAMDGIACGGSGPQTVRLTINGVARAAGKLGNAEGVRRAVAKACDLLEQHQAPSGVPSSIGLGCYSPAQVASNAATAFVSLGMPREVQHYVDLAMPDISRSDSPWSRSLVMLDLASSLIRSDDHDLDHATDLVLDALAISQGRPIVSVQQRGLEFVANATARWGNARQVSSVREAIAAAMGQPR